ncbi:MAG: RNA-directed DNA polymerase [Pseudomonadota bacterium]
MTKGIDPDTIAVRALNYWRPMFLPSYLGMRHFLDQMGRGGPREFLLAFLHHKLPLRKQARYMPFTLFKSINDLGDIEYRKCFAASPTSAFAESLALYYLSSVKTLENKKNVYSYLWPKSEASGSSFRYFMEGFQAREYEVTNILRNNPQNVLLVYDVKKFYPSVKTDSVRNRLHAHLSDIDENKRRFVLSVAEQLLVTAQQGIPVGPSVSCVLGNLAMEQVDDKLINAFGNGYLRYVDDIYLICTKDRVTEANELVGAAIRNEGLNVQEAKNDELTSNDWLVSCPSIHERRLAIRFQLHMERIRVFLLQKETRLESLKRSYRGEGFSLPLQRLAATASYTRWIKYILNRRTQSWKYLFDSEKKLLKSAHELREDFLHAAQQVAGWCPIPRQGMMRRRWVTRLRFTLNRLLYLCPRELYPQLLELMPSINEFYVHRQLLKALIKNDLDEIIQLPGPAVSTFASIWREGGDSPPLYTKALLDAEGCFESICTLVSHGAIAPPENWVEKLTLERAELINFCRGYCPEKKRILGDRSFVDEIRSLQLGSEAEANANFLDWRYSDGEISHIDGLRLSAYGSI